MSSEFNEIAYCKTPIGTAKLVGNLIGLQSVTISDVVFEERPQTIPNSLKEPVQQLQDYFYKGLKEFHLKLNPKGTDFQLKIGQLLQEIPYGSTLSYRELAQRFGNVKAIRAIAHANAQNPLWIVVPCHRIIGLNGDLTGYAGGIWRKKYLLELENKSYQTKLF